MALPYTDPFIAPDNTLLTAYNPLYEDVQGQMQIEGNAATPNYAPAGVPTVCCVALAEAFDDAQFVEGTIAAISGGNFVGIGVRAGAAASANYYSLIGNSSTSFLIRVDAGLFTVLGTGSAWNLGDVIRLEADGTTITPFLNGLPDIAPVVDATYPSGRGAVAGYGDDVLLGVSPVTYGNLHAAAAGIFPGIMP